jgi:hypothetical protein
MHKVHNARGYALGATCSGLKGIGGRGRGRLGLPTPRSCYQTLTNVREPHWIDWI